MRQLTGELLALNTATLGHRQKFSEIVEQVAQAGFGAITPWRVEIDEANPQTNAQQIRAAGLQVNGYCRTAYLTGIDDNACHKAIEDNRVALNAAAELGAKHFIAVVGGLAHKQQSVTEARKQILDGLAQLGETAKQLAIPIALEPLHPYYAAERSLLNTITQALDWCQQLDSDIFGICIDSYHTWWEPQLESAITAAGNKILAFHVSDWLVPTKDPVFDRGMPGDGVIDNRTIRNMVEQTGFDGFIEVEIFSKDNWWQQEPQKVLETCYQRLTTVV